MKALAELRWLDALETSPLVAGDTRFLRENFLPAHGQYHEKRYAAALAELDKRAARAPDAATLAARGRVRRLLGDRAGARADFEAAIELDADCAEAFAYRGEEKLVADPRAALADLERAAAAAPKNAYWRLWLGYARAVAGENGLALAALDRALALDPKIRSARILRGILRERGRDFAGAEKDFSAVAKLLPRCPGIFTLRATARWRLGRRKESLADASKALLLHPENLDAFVRIVYLHKNWRHGEEKRQQNAMVAQIADEFLKEDPRCAWAYALKAEVVEETRVSKKADLKTRFHERAVALDPRNAWMQAFLGRSLSGLRKSPRMVRRGLKHLDRAVALRPDIGWIRSWRAEVLDKLGEEKRALRDLDAGIAADPYYRLANAWRAALRERRGDDAGALEDLDACLAVMPRPGFFHQRALVRWRLGQEAAAAADLSRCVGLATKLGLGYGTFGWLLQFEGGAPARGPRRVSPLRARGELRRALAGAGGGDLRAVPLNEAAIHAVIMQLPAYAFRAAWRGLELKAGRFAALSAISPNDAPLAAWLGRALLAEGDFAGAEEALARAARLDPRSGLAASWRGEARFRRGDYAGAVAELDRALVLAPAFLPSSLWRCLAHLALGREAEALQDLLGACRADPASASRVAVWARWSIPRFWSRMRRAGPVQPLAEFALLTGQYGKASRLLSRDEAGLGAEGWVLRGLASGQAGLAERAEAELARGACVDAERAAKKLAASLKGLPGARRELLGAAYAALAQAWALAGREDDSARAYALASELGGDAAGAPGLAAALLRRARVKRETGDLRGALEDARRAAELQAKKPLTGKNAAGILTKSPVPGENR